MGDLQNAGVEPKKVKAGKFRAAGEGLIAVSTSQPGGRRRAGFALGATPIEIDLAELTIEQLEALEADPTVSIKPVK